MDQKLNDFFEIYRAYNFGDKYIKIKQRLFSPSCIYTVNINGEYAGEMFFSRSDSFFKIGGNYFSVTPKSFWQILHHFVIRDLNSGKILGQIRQTFFDGMKVVLRNENYAIINGRQDYWRPFEGKMIEKNGAESRLDFIFKLGASNKSDKYDQPFIGVISIINKEDLLLLFAFLHAMEFELYLSLSNAD